MDSCGAYTFVTTTRRMAEIILTHTCVCVCVCVYYSYLSQGGILY